MTWKTFLIPTIDAVSSMKKKKYLKYRELETELSKYFHKYEKYSRENDSTGDVKIKM